MEKAWINQCRNEVTDDYNGFFRCTGLINDYREIEWLGFNLQNFCGLFYPRHLPDLTAFCAENEEYHIISVMPGHVYQNRCLEGASCYFLANGDKNPDLVLQPFLHKSVELFQEEVFEKALTMFGNVNRSYQR